MKQVLMVLILLPSLSPFPPPAPSRSVLLPLFFSRTSLLQVMVCDPYANYVVQKIIDVADQEQRQTIIMEIRAHASQLKRWVGGWVPRSSCFASARFFLFGGGGDWLFCGSCSVCCTWLCCTWLCSFLSCGWLV